MTMSLLLIIIGGLISIIGSLILLNLQSIKRCISKLSNRIEKQDSVIATIKENNDILSISMSKFEVACHQEFVASEAFLRETGFTRRTLEVQTASINRIEGQLTLIDKLPAICGDISRNIVREMKDAE